MTKKVDLFHNHSFNTFRDGLEKLGYEMKAGMSWKTHEGFRYDNMVEFFIFGDPEHSKIIVQNFEDNKGYRLFIEHEGSNAISDDIKFVINGKQDEKTKTELRRANRALKSAALYGDKKVKEIIQEYQMGLR